MRVECSCGSEAPLVLASPYLEILDSYLKVLCLLYIQQALTSRFNYSTLDQRSLVKSATRSIGLQWLIHVLPVLQRVSCSFEETHPYDIYHKGDITLVTLGSVLACSFFVQKRSYFSIVTFLFAHIVMLTLFIFWLSRRNWSIGCFRTIIGEHFCLPN
jgi:hypothetical protein